MRGAMVACAATLLLCSCATVPVRQIMVDVERQRLTVVTPAGKKEYPCSTAWRGTGNRPGSRRTPLGKHEVVRKIAPGDPGYAGRVPGYKLWIAGPDCPVSRCVYIHVCRRKGKIGRPASDGCVHLLPEDLEQLFNTAPVGTPVIIK